MEEPAAINNPRRKIQPKPEIPSDLQGQWQCMLDAFIGVTGLSGALITRADHGPNEVFLSSRASRDFDHTSKSCDLNLSSFCEQVTRGRFPLLVTQKSDVAKGEHPSCIVPPCALYLRYPLLWPDGELFGTLCIHDRRDPPQAELIEKAVTALHSMFEQELRMICEARGRDHLLSERLRFEVLVAEISASFVNVSPERVNDAIGEVLEKIRRFFASDHCGILEVLSERSQVLMTTPDCRENGTIRKKDIDLMQFHPWFYSQVIEQGKNMIFSSLESLPPEAASDRVTWKSVNVHSACLLPLNAGRKVTHMIGLWNSSGGCEWSAVHVEHLRLLGQMFISALIHKRDRKSLIRSERTLSESQRIARVGSWEWDIRCGTLHWSEQFYRILGLHPRETEATCEKFLTCVHPDDRQAIQQAINRAMSAPGQPYSIECRVVRPDGTERHVQARGEFSFDQDRRPVHMLAILHDITEHKQAEHALKKAFDEVRTLKKQLEIENLYLRKDTEFESRFKGVLGVSNAIKYVTHRIQKVATTGATVLLTGETGTGKGVFARALHVQSERKDKPFVHVNCAGLPANLIESELFGREKGAFTGSTARQIGRFELADGGTIFLDEIGELPLELQSKLLKVLEDGEFERLGSPHTVKVDVRVIASTNRNLVEESRKGRFRMDLFYRLNVFPVTVPPLRQRRDDIPLFVRFFTKRLSKRYGKEIQRIPQETMQVLERYDWPGNVRELANVIERAVILSDGPVLHLAEKIDGRPEGPDGPILEKTLDSDIPLSSKDIVEVEREHILTTLLQTGWKISGPNGAAQRVGLNPNTLRSRMKKLGIRRPGTP
ncbi:MAG: sigma 54-interacting transcriptional regulator [Desulfatiglandales bacterium]